MKKILLLMALVSFTFTNAQILSSVDFEDGTTGDWSIVQVNGSETWVVIDAVGDNTSTKMLQCVYDPAFVDQDERLVSAAIDFAGGGADSTASISFQYNMSYHWGVDPEDNYDLNLLISVDGGTTWSEIWDETMDSTFDSTEENFVSRTINVALGSMYVSETDVRFSFQYIGNDGASAALDDIIVYATDSAASIQDDVLSSSVSIYPTATNELFTINNKSNIALTSVSLFDVNGRVVLTQSLDNLIGEKSINVASLTAGMYFVEINSTDAKLTRKLIKK